MDTAGWCEPQGALRGVGGREGGGKEQCGASRRAVTTLGLGNEVCEMCKNEQLST